MARMFDRYRNVARRGEGLILRAGDPFPYGAIPEEWRKDSTVPESKLSDADKADIAANGYRYFKMKVEIKEEIYPRAK
jgi:hypothetical protein